MRKKPRFLLIFNVDMLQLPVHGRLYLCDEGKRQMCMECAVDSWQVSFCVLEDGRRKGCAYARRFVTLSPIIAPLDRSRNNATLDIVSLVLKTLPPNTSFSQNTR